MIEYRAGSHVTIVDVCQGPKLIPGIVGDRRVSTQENLWFKFVPDDTNLSEYFITDDLVAGFATSHARRFSPNAQECT